DVSAKFKLVGSGAEGNREVELKNTFHNGSTKAGIDDFIPWKDLIDMNKGFINDQGEISIEARFTLSDIVGISPVIDFTDSNDARHDITLIFDGGVKLYANKQTLAVHSPVFNAMFYGNFTEKDKKEIELKGVDREVFHEILKALYDPSYGFKEDMRLLESLLVIADRFDFKVVIESIEECVAVNCDKLSLAKTLLFVDQHDSFRFIKLHTNAFEFFFGRDSDISSSEEYHQLSDTAKSAYDQIRGMLPDYSSKFFPFWSRSNGACLKMKEADNLPEAKNLVASGCFPTVFDVNSEKGGVLSSTYVCHTHVDTPMDFGGLLWSIDAKNDLLKLADGSDREIIRLKLIANQDRPSKFEWTAEGIMETESTFLAKGGITLKDHEDPTYSLDLVDEKEEQIDPFSINPYPIKKQFSFSLDSTNRKGMTPIFCVITRTRDGVIGEEREEEGEGWKAPKILVKTRIHLTKVTGVRPKPHFDFTCADSSSDAILIVEEKELHVHTQYLSNISTVFRTMFEDNSTGIDNRYDLKGVAYQDCIHFLRWIYPSSVKNFDDDAMSRMAVMAKKFNVPFILDDIADVLRYMHCFEGLKMLLFFGFECKVEFCCNSYGTEYVDWKSIYREIENSPAYKAMDADATREMFEWICSKINVSH
ncbi:hypothetical protein PMAYCL1PPCAC_05438, partial [Pristionchus mayeri]